MDFSNISDHPDFQEIISKIYTGVSAKDISNWLRVKYPTKDQKHLQLSSKNIQEFIDKHGNAEVNIQRDILAVRTGEIIGAGSPQISAALLNNKTYVERVTELANAKLDIKKVVEELVHACKARMEQVFDSLQRNPTSVGKNDYVLIKYFEVLFKAVETFNKVVNEAPDQIVQHNFTIQSVENHVGVIQEALRATLAMIDAEAASHFMDLLNENLKKLKAPKPEEPMTLEDQMIEAQVLRKKLPGGDGNDGSSGAPSGMSI